MITGFDHIVLTVSDIERAADFYVRVLGMQKQHFGDGRTALKFGTQKINLQTLGMERRNHAAVGSGDICLVTGWSPQQIADHLAAENVHVLEGPVQKTGAQGPITSIYFNDPDGNLVEISSYGAN